MKQIEKALLIEGKLASFLADVAKELWYQVMGFENFSKEAILYALIEYARFHREDTAVSRLQYLYGKCLEFNGKLHVYGNVEFSTLYNQYVVTFPEPKEEDARTCENCSMQNSCKNYRLGGKGFVTHCYELKRKA